MIHKLIKAARQQQSLSQAGLAFLADVPRSQIQILEKGGNVTRETIEKVVNVMGMSLAVISRDDIAQMREALAELDDVLGRLAAQVTAPAYPDPRRIVAMGDDVVEMVRADHGDEAAARARAVYDEAAATVDESIVQVEEEERQRQQKMRAERAALRARVRGRGPRG